MAEAKKVRPSRSSQPVEDGVWYYEHPGALQFGAWTQHAPGVRRVRQFRVRWSRLAESAERCGWKLTRVAKPARKPRSRPKAAAKRAPRRTSK